MQKAESVEVVARKFLDLLIRRKRECCMLLTFRRSPLASDATDYMLSVRSVEE